MKKKWHRNNHICNQLYQNHLQSLRIQAVFAITEKVVGKYAKYEEARCQENSSLSGTFIEPPLNTLTELRCHDINVEIFIGKKPLKRSSRLGHLEKNDRHAGCKANDW